MLDSEEFDGVLSDMEKIVIVHMWSVAEGIREKREAIQPVVFGTGGEKNMIALLDMDKDQWPERARAIGRVEGTTAVGLISECYIAITGKGGEREFAGMVSAVEAGVPVRDLPEARDAVQMIVELKNRGSIHIYALLLEDETLGKATCIYSSQISEGKISGFFDV